MCGLGVKIENLVIRIEKLDIKPKNLDIRIEKLDIKPENLDIRIEVVYYFLCVFYYQMNVSEWRGI